MIDTALLETIVCFLEACQTRPREASGLCSRTWSVMLSDEMV